MIKQASPKLIGTFIVGAVALIVVMFIVFGSGGVFKTKNEYVIYFRGSTSGLSSGAPVKVKGVQVGSVTKITPIMDIDESFKVEVNFETVEGLIKDIGERNEDFSQIKEVKSLIKKGFKGQLATESMVTGKLYIKVDFFPDAPIILEGLNPDLVEIPSVPTTSELLERDVKEMLNEMSKIQFQRLSNNINNLVEGIDSLVRSPLIFHNMKALKENMRLSQKLIAHLDSAIAPATNNMAEITNSVNQTLEAVRQLVVNLDNVTANNRYEIHLLLKELKTTSRSIRNMTDYLERNPSSMIIGK